MSKWYSDPNLNIFLREIDSDKRVLSKTAIRKISDLQNCKSLQKIKIQCYATQIFRETNYNRAQELLYKLFSKITSKPVK